MITVNSLEVDVGVRFVGRPVLLEIEQEVRPVSGKTVAVEVFEGKREPVVDADDGQCVLREFLAELFGKTPPSPVPAKARRRLNLLRRAGTLGNVNHEPVQPDSGACAPELSMPMYRSNWGNHGLPDVLMVSA